MLEWERCTNIQDATDIKSIIVYKKNWMHSINRLQNFFRTETCQQMRIINFSKIISLLFPLTSNPCNQLYMFLLRKLNIFIIDKCKTNKNSRVTKPDNKVNVFIYKYRVFVSTKFQSIKCCIYLFVLIFIQTVHRDNTNYHGNFYLN